MVIDAYSVWKLNLSQFLLLFSIWVHTYYPLEIGNVCTFLEMNYKHSTKYGDILYISYSDSCGYITYT